MSRMWRIQIFGNDSGPPGWRLGEGLTNSHRKKRVCYEMLNRASELVSPSEHGNEPSGSINGGEFLD
jgi:hypothetical protein